jgi:hypothetical protein
MAGFYSAAVRTSNRFRGPLCLRESQAHSARAVLSGLRKAGYTIEREAPGEGRNASSVYRITAAPEGAA